MRKDWARALAEYEAGRSVAPNNADLLRGIGVVAKSEGRWDECLAALRQARMLDPRSAETARRLTYALVESRRYPEALAETDRALALDPHDPVFYQTRAMVFLSDGDLPRARAVLDTAQREVEPTALVADMANYLDLF